MNSGIRLTPLALPASHRRRLTASQLKSAVAKGILSENKPTSPMPARPTTKRTTRRAAAPQVTQAEAVPAHPHQTLIAEESKLQVALLASSAAYVQCSEELARINSEMHQLRADLHAVQDDLAECVKQLPGGRQQDG